MKSRMHPGWAAFFLAWGSGIFTILAMTATVSMMTGALPWGYIVFTGGIAVLLFAFGGRRAEQLTDYKLKFSARLMLWGDPAILRNIIAREIWAYNELDQQVGPFDADYERPGAGNMAGLQKRLCTDQAERIRARIAGML